MGKKILVVDDHPETVRLIALTLRRHGYDVVGAQSGPQGLEMAEAEPPDLILLDMMMPGMDGVTVCRALREHAQLRHLPVIMFTAKSQVQDKKASFEAGADDYLVKPTKPGELISRVEAILARSAGPGEWVPERGGEPSGGPTRPEAQALIVVVGVRGGAGATTVALNLAVSLADNGQETALLDLDLRQGHIATYLGHRVQQDVGAWLEQPAHLLRLQLTRYFVRHGDGLHLLLARPHLGQEERLPQGVDMQAVADALLESGRSVVIDLGSNSGRPIYPLLQAASHVLVCLRPERAAITATKQLFASFRPLLKQPEKLHALMLDYGLVDNLPRRSVESFLGFPLLDVIKLNPQQIAEAVNRDLPLVHLHPHSQWTQHFHKLARQLVPA